mgnify:CR=1 FL=1
MKIAIYGLGIMGGIALTIASILFTNHRIASIWVGFATGVIFLLSFSLYWHNEIKSNVKLEEPTFSEEVNKVSFSLGEGGITDITNVDKIKKSPREPFNFGGFKPIKIYFSEGKLYADVKIYRGVNLPSLELKRNKLINKPPDWDFNSNKNALEVVNEKQIPIYQFFYKTPSHIVMNGIFPFPGGLILANENGAIINPILPATFSLKRIFKYPSWKYPGKYEK